ncbi:MAG: transposase [Methylobacteriaceae bacterium]|nr:transposase [Methylobacteriaceae bacterium]
MDGIKNGKDGRVTVICRLHRALRHLCLRQGYCHYGFWRAIHAAGAIFLARPKLNMGLKLIHQCSVALAEGDGFTILQDAEVQFASKGDSKLPMRLRRIRLKRHEGGSTITHLTNDLERSAVEIAALYKGRWQIELLFSGRGRRRASPARPG